MKLLERKKEEFVMKKLLALVLILAMASVSSAATVDIVVNDTPWDGESSVYTSDIITITFYDDTGVAGPFAQFEMAVDHGDYVEDSFATVPGNFMGAPLAVTAPVEDGLVVAGSPMWMPGTLAPDGLYTVAFHVPGDLEESTLINITFSGGYLGADTSALSTAIHVVPEPMTIALLGLGGLFLRRRRS